MFHPKKLIFVKFSFEKKVFMDFFIWVLSSVLVDTFKRLLPSHGTNSSFPRADSENYNRALYAFFPLLVEYIVFTQIQHNFEFKMAPRD